MNKSNNDNVSVDISNDSTNTLSKLTSLNATATSQVQLWERLVEENEDEDFSVASYAGQKQFFVDDDNSTENNSIDDDNVYDGNNDDKSIYKVKVGNSLGISIDNDYANRYANVDDDDDDDTDNDNDPGRDDIY